MAFWDISPDEYYIKSNKAIGKGAFCSVYLGENRYTKQQVVMKKVQNKPEYIKAAHKEIDILSRFRNQSHHCVYFYGKVTLDKHLYLIFEKLDTNLYTFQKKYADLLTMKNVIHIAYQLTAALEFIHSIAIHCDLKHENIMIDTKTLYVKIIDFGSSVLKQKKKPETDYVVSRYYRSPEIIFGLPYITSVDIWSYGCIISELLIGTPLFPAKSQRDLIFKIASQINIPSLSEYKESRYYSVYFKHVETGFPFKNRLIHDSLTMNKIYNDYNQFNLKVTLFEGCFKNINLKATEYEIKFITSMIESVLIYDYKNRPRAEELINNKLFLEYKLGFV